MSEVVLTCHSGVGSEAVLYVVIRQIGRGSRELSKCTSMWVLLLSQFPKRYIETETKERQ